MLGPRRSLRPVVCPWRAGPHAEAKANKTQKDNPMLESANRHHERILAHMDQVCQHLNSEVQIARHHCRVVGSLAADLSASAGQLKAALSWPSELDQHDHGVVVLDEDEGR